MERKCIVAGCGGKHYGRGWCHTHYVNWYKRGDPFAEPTRRPARHGSKGMYTNHGCRCASCCKANTIAQREYFARHPEQWEKHKERERRAYAEGRRGERSQRPKRVVRP